jgi:glycosyltransferase 2 family protein
MKAKTILKLVISIGLLVAILATVGISELWQVVINADKQLLVFAFLFSPLILISKGVKWLLLGRQVAPNITFISATYSLIVGMGISIATPGRVGELARVSYLPTEYKSELLGVVAVDRLTDLITVMLVGALALGVSISWRLGFMVMAPTLLLLILLFAPHLPEKLIKRAASVGWIPGKVLLGKIAYGLSMMNGRAMITAHFIAFAILALALIQFYWLLRAFGIDSMVAALVSFPVLTVAGVIPVTISGFGAREGAAVFALALYNVPEAVAFNAALLSFAFNTLVPGIAGLLISPMVSFDRTN